MWRSRARVVAAALLACAGMAHAELNFGPYVAGEYLYESNVYKFSSQVQEVTATPQTEDSSQRYRLGLDVDYTWQRQRFQVVTEGRTHKYEKFRDLDHDEYLAAAEYSGRILDATSVLLAYRGEERAASFEDRRSRELVIENDQSGRGELGVAVTPVWQIITTARGRNLRSPLPAAPALPQPPPGAPARVASPDFGVHEAGVGAGVLYGIDNKEHPEDEAPLLLGVMLDYQTVHFSGVSRPPDPPPPTLPIIGVQGEAFNEFQDYALLALQATGRYAVSGLSVLDGKLGVTLLQPERASADSRPALTGEVGYTRRVSPLTQVSAKIFRRIVTNVANADATTDSGIAVGAKWEPILDLTVVGDYSWASSAFEGLSGFATENAGRSDDVQNGTLSVGYPKGSLLFFQVYTSYADRRSSAGYNDYNDVTAGASLRIGLGRKKPE
ncbi:MAG TPA: hypothetical protein VM240_02505 [Verrucomicrobiae bacterium]|nr:hypothetical protein [Verrucomicrobiae bacterium]